MILRIMLRPSHRSFAWPSQNILSRLLVIDLQAGKFRTIPTMKYRPALWRAHTKLKARTRKHPGLELCCDQNPSICVSFEASFRLETCRVELYLARGYIFHALHCFYFFMSLRASTGRRARPSRPPRSAPALHHRTTVQHSIPLFTIVHHLIQSAYHVRYATASGAVDVWHANRCRDNSCEAKQGARATEQTTDTCREERSNMHWNP